MKLSVHERWINLRVFVFIHGFIAIRLDVYASRTLCKSPQILRECAIVNLSPRNFSFLLLIAFLCALLTGCGDPAAKKAAFLEKGRSLYGQGDYVHARLEFKNAIQIDLEDAPAYFALGQTELKLKNYQQAYGAFSKAVDLAPDNLEYRLERARLLVAGRAYEQAAKDIEVILEKNSGRSEALLLQARVALGQGRPEEARKILTGLVKRPKPPADAYILLAATDLRAGQVKAARELLAQARTSYPKTPSVFLMSARAALADHDINQAIADLQRATELAPENKDYALQLAGIYWQAGRREEAEKIFARLEDDPENGWRQAMRIAAFMSARREMKQAETELRKAQARWPDSLAVRLRLAEIYAASGRLDQGISLIKEFLGRVNDDAAPDALTARTALARLHLAAGALDDAEADVNKVIAESANNVEAHFIKGRIMLLRNKPVDAISDFRTVVSEKPDFAPGHLRLADAYLMNKQKGLAYDTLNAALETMPRSREINLALARLYTLDGKKEKAGKVLRTLAGYDPDDPEIGVVLGDWYAAVGDRDAARAQYRSVSEKSPAAPLPYLRLARLALQDKNPKQAIKELRRGLKAAPRANVLLDALVRIAISHKKYNTALAACRRRLDADARDAYALNLIGKVYAAQKKHAKARDAFQQAAALAPQWTEPMANLAKLLLAEGQKEKAAAQFQDNIKKNPDDMADYLFLAALHEQSGEYAKAAKVYEKAVARRPDFWPAANNLAYLLSEHGTGPADLDRALTLIKKTMARRPGVPEIMDTAAWIHFQRGDMDEARTLLGNALEKDPENPVLNYHMAMVYKYDGRHGLALAAIRKAVEAQRPFAEQERARALYDELRKTGH